MPALLQDAYRGVSPAVLATWPGGVGALNVPIPLRGGGVKELIAKFSAMSNKKNTPAPKFNVWNRSTNYGATIPAVGGARKHRRRPTRKAHRKSRRLTRRR